MQQSKSICLWRTHLAFTLLFAGTLGPQALPQTAEKIPLPEYFGIYAIDNGKLTSVREGKSAYQSSVREIHVYSMAGGVDKTVSAPELSSDVRFIIFNPSPGEMAHDLSLYKLGYVRNFLQGNSLLAVLGNENVKISPVNRWLAARLPGSQVGLLSKPLGSQPQMIQVVPQVQLLPGVYALFHAKDKWSQIFVVAFSEPSNASECIDISFRTQGPGGPANMTVYLAQYGPPEFPEITKEHYIPCSGNPSNVSGPPSPGRTNNPAIEPGQPLASAKANCADYNACLKSGIEAHFASQWQQAIADFEEASKQSPTKADPWGWLGRVYLALGRYQEAVAMWDKKLSLGGRLVFQVCLERSFKPCERGNLSLAPEEVSFTLLDNRNLFAVAPSDGRAMKMGIFKNSSRGFINLQVKDEKYLFEYSPDGGNCRIQSIVECPQKELVEQQVAVRNYVLQTIPKLASGAFAQPKQPATQLDAQRIVEEVRNEIASYEKTDKFSSPLDDQQFLVSIVGESEQSGIPPWLLFAQARFETTFGNPINATTREGVTFTDGSTGSAHNLFNIRPGASWQGKVLDTGRGGQFRAYNNYDDCVRDYLRIISSDSYKGKTLEHVINTYFPASENGPARVQTYIDSVIQFASKLGFAVNGSTVPVP